MTGKLIVVEGTDCSGKETQTNMLMDRMTKDGYKVKKYSFPNYDSPTGKIVGGPYLGKSYICDGWFSEGATNVNYKVASLYYAADRLYNIDQILNDLNNGYYVILDRYVYSNMAHQGAKIKESKERIELYDWLEKLEFEMLNLPVADIKIFLHMPTEYSKILKLNRLEAPDQHEADEEHLKCAEEAYIEMSDKYDFNVIECVSNNTIKTVEEINNELVKIVYEII